MCGIVGAWLSARSKLLGNREFLDEMRDALRHRGPDGSGTWWSEKHHVGFGHRRLAIVDLSPNGHQPMVSPSGRYVITFNGEIYNFKTLRSELQAVGFKFRGESDTEVMLAAFDHWGLESALKRFNGMFAFAVWDEELGRLSLARDRLGKKPLYLAVRDGCIYFASELKALRAVPGLQWAVDRRSLASFLRFAYVPAPFTIFESVEKLEAGTVMHASRDGAETIAVERKRYWSPIDCLALENHQSFAGSYDEALGIADDILFDAVRIRMISDVPLGAFLSGGIDSSLVVALMAAQSASKVKTFSIGFEEAEFNEADYAKRVAAHLGTQHTELYVTARSAQSVVPLMAETFDEPFADSSQIPTFIVSSLARRDVTVALSGDGGDELFGGYNRYFLWQPIWRAMRPVPRSARKTVGLRLMSASPRVRKALASTLSPIARTIGAGTVTSERLSKLGGLLAADSPLDIFIRSLTHWPVSQRTVNGATERDDVIAEILSYPEYLAVTEKMMLHDTLHYLPDDILVKVDRASMAVSLECRAPLLDYRMFEFAARLPLDFKLSSSSGKRILKDLAYRHVPKDLLDRPKTGFGVPIGDWLRTDLRDWSESLLDAARLRDEGYFCVDEVRAQWEAHVSGREQNHYGLWTVLMFQAWLEKQRTVT